MGINLRYVEPSILYGVPSLRKKRPRISGDELKHLRANLWEWSTTGKKLIQDLSDARATIVAHHSTGAMDDVRLGDECPVCTHMGWHD